MNRLILGTGAAGRLNHASEIRSLLSSCLRAGADAFDTAPLYGSGAMESLLGQVLKAEHAGPDVLVNTKFGLAPTVKIPRPADFYFAAKIAQVVGRRLGMNGSPSLLKTTVVAAATDALERATKLFGLDRIDVFFAHEVPMEVLATPEFLEFIRHGKQQRQFRRFGLGGYRSIYQNSDEETSWNHVDVLQVESIPGERPITPSGWSGEIFLHGVLAPLRRTGSTPASAEALHNCFHEALEIQGASRLVVGVSRLANFQTAVDALRS